MSEFSAEFSVKWIEYGKPFSSFKREGLLVPMTIIMLQPSPEPRFDGWPEGPQLVGTVNDLGGLCDDCPIDRDTIVTRYAVLFSWNTLLRELSSS